MAKIEDIVKKINFLAPLETQEDWDNSGWQVRLQKNDIKKIMLCVTLTDDVLKQAKENHCDMIIAHHPVYFKGFEDKEIVREIIRNHIPVYSIHTPFDKATNGTTDMLIKSCGLNIDETLNEFTKISNTEIKLNDLILKLKKGLSIDTLRVTNFKPEKIIKRIAFCAGSGTSFCDEVEKLGCDCFVTADLKYHTASDFIGTIIDVGHLESEKPALKTIKDNLNDVECIIAEENSNIITV